MTAGIEINARNQMLVSLIRNRSISGDVAQFE